MTYDEKNTLASLFILTYADDSIIWYVYMQFLRAIFQLHAIFSEKLTILIAFAVLPFLFFKIAT